MARPRRGHEHFVAKLLPDQAKALRNAALRAKLEGLPEAGDGASRIVRQLVQAWIDAGAKWPAGDVTERLEKAQKGAARAFAALVSDASPEAVKESRAAGRRVDEEVRRVKAEIRSLKKRRKR